MPSSFDFIIVYAVWKTWHDPFFDVFQYLGIITICSRRPSICSSKIVKNMNDVAKKRKTLSRIDEMWKLIYNIAVFNGLVLVVRKMTISKAWHRLFLSQCLVAAISTRRSNRYVRQIRCWGMDGGCCQVIESSIIAHGCIKFKNSINYFEVIERFCEILGSYKGVLTGYQVLILSRCMVSAKLDMIKSLMCLAIWA